MLTLVVSRSVWLARRYRMWFEPRVRSGAPQPYLHQRKSLKMKFAENLCLRRTQKWDGAGWRSWAFQRLAGRSERSCWVYKSDETGNTVGQSQLFPLNFFRYLRGTCVQWACCPGSRACPRKEKHTPVSEEFHRKT
jgi:hypothetical protein